MASDDEVFDETSFDPTFATAGPRRSTFTPPTGSVPASPELPAEHDDDELANALAADLGRLSSGSIPVVPEAAPAAEPAPEPMDAAPEPADSPQDATTAEPGPVAELPAWSSLPAPDPAQAVVLPEGPPEPVVRDPELLSLLEQAGLETGGGTLSAIEQLEAQLSARGIPVGPTEQPADVAPVDVPAVDVAPVSVAESFVVDDQPVAAWPVPQTDDAPRVNDTVPVEPVVLEPVIEAEPVVAAPPPLPAWDVPPPSAGWASTLSEPEPELAPEPLPAPMPEPEPAPEPEPVPEPEPAIEPGPVFEPEPKPEPVFVPEPPVDAGPPPLVEPPILGGPPLLPSQAAGHPPIPIVPIPEYEEVIEAEVVEDEPPAAAPPPPAFSFDDLLSGPADDDLRPEADEGRPFSAETLFEEPAPVTASQGVPLDTDSIAVIDRAYEEELDDDVDDTDRAFAGLVGGAAIVSPPSGPISTVRIPEDEVVLIDNEPVRQRVFSVEAGGLEPTPVDHRVGRAARLFWLWFAANSSILSIGLGAAVFAVGMSLRQSIVSVLAGVALSFIPLGLSTLAGKRSGQPTMVVSRATFGVAGNVVPALLAVVTRVFWGAVLLWLLASSVAVVLAGAELDGGLGERLLLILGLAAGLVIAMLVAVVGYHLIAQIQLVLSVVSGILIIGLIVMTAQYVDVPAALTTPDGPWLLTITGAVLVFSFVGLVWANSGADLARYQRPGSSGAASMLWSTIGATLPSFVLIGYGALLAASDKGIASGFVQSPLDTLALMLPSWYPAPLIAAAVLSLLSGIVITLYSGGFALQSVGVRVSRQWSVVIVGVLLAAIAVVLSFAVTGIMELFRDLATTLAVPTAAWAGIFAAEMMIRNRRFESESLLRRGGVYETVRWGNLIGFVVISAIGWGLTTATVTWLGWQGYLFGLLGVPLDTDLAATDLGVLVALALGILLPIVIGIPAIRRQEETRP
ncbi:MAG: cytosine permease [Actinobacteria bacterium]|nr:cytosine permease [Actinomycetota bacterium]